MREKLLALCTHERCKMLDLETMAASFDKMDIFDRVKCVRSALFLPAARPGEINELVGDPTEALGRERRRRFHAGNAEAKLGERATVVYVLRGKYVCRHVFAAVTQVSESTVEQYLHKIAYTEAFDPLHNKRNERHLDKKGVQRSVVVSFLTQYGEEFGLESPVGRHNKRDRVCRILPVGSTLDVFDIGIADQAYEPIDVVPADVPTKITVEEILEGQKTDSFCQTVLARQSKRIDSAFFEGPDGLLRRHHPREAGIEQIVLPDTLRPRVLELAHHAKLPGHPGQTRMYYHVRRTYY